MSEKVSKFIPWLLMLLAIAVVLLSVGYYFLYADIQSLKEAKPYRNKGNVIFWEEVENVNP